MNIWEGVGARDEAKRFCELWGIPGTVLVDDQNVLLDALGIRGVPTNVFVDVDGTITSVGAVTPEDLEAATHRLLGPGADIDPPERRAWHWEKEPEHIERHIAKPGGAGQGAPS